MTLLPGFILSLTLPLLAGDPKPTTARQVAEGYVTAALAGKSDDAAALGVEGTSPARPMSAEKLKAIVGKEKLPLGSVVASDTGGFALAVTGGFKPADPKPGRPETACLVLTLRKTKDGWRVKDIDLRTDDEAKKQLEAAREKYPDAKEIPAAKPS